MDIHKELALDVLGRKTTEAGTELVIYDYTRYRHILDFVKDNTGGLVYAEEANNGTDQSQNGHYLIVRDW